MNRSFFISRSLKSALLCSLLFCLAGPSDLIPSAEAAGSRDKRKIKKLKRQVKVLRRTVSNLQTQLAAARRPVTDPAPFVELVTVGNVGNATDAGNTSEASVYGAVNYEFQIGKYEVTLAQYTAFLNAVAATDPNGLYNSSMATSLNVAGIGRSGSDGSYTYTAIGNGDRPVTYVSWFDAARFCNWLHNERPTGTQDAETTERGAYTLDGATSGTSFTRNPGAKFWIPSEDEWYKAAYHQPSGESGDSDNYWQYPTGSNTTPGNDIGATPNQANHSTGGYSVTQSGTLIPSQNYLTNGGAYESSASFYGTFDQGGNVFEWIDAAVSISARRIRGGSWLGFEGFLLSSYKGSNDADLGIPTIGFRIASP